MRRARSTLPTRRIRPSELPGILGRALPAWRGRAAPRVRGALRRPPGRARASASAVQLAARSAGGRGGRGRAGRREPRRRRPEPDRPGGGHRGPRGRRPRSLSRAAADPGRAGRAPRPGPHPRRGGARSTWPSFETAEFHDRLRRATLNASERSWQVSMAIVSFFSRGGHLRGAGRRCSAGSSRSILPGRPPRLRPAAPRHHPQRPGQSYEFEYAMTTPDRERAYLGGVLYGRAEAKEVRLFDSRRWIRGPVRPALRPAHHRAAEGVRAAAPPLADRRRRDDPRHGRWASALLIQLGAVAAGSRRPRRASPPWRSSSSATRLRSLGQNAGTLHECSLFLRRRHDVPRGCPSSADDGDRPRRPRPLRSASSSTDLHFTYPGTDREVLHGVSLEIGARGGRRARRRQRLGQDHAGQAAVRPVRADRRADPLGRRRRRRVRPDGRSGAAWPPCSRTSSATS